MPFSNVHLLLDNIKQRLMIINVGGHKSRHNGKVDH